jgi:hypothetical protein
MFCALCGQRISRFGAWKSASGNMYCSEFCAEAETIEPAIAVHPQANLAEDAGRGRTGSQTRTIQA